MSVVKWHPVGEMLGRATSFQRSFGNGSSRGRGNVAAPTLSLDVYETEAELVLTASLPGARSNTKAVC